MAALTGPRNTLESHRRRTSVPLAAATTVYQGGIAVRNAAGYGAPGSTATTLRAVGIWRQTVANPGAAGAASAEAERGCFRFDNSASGDLITIADIGATAYIVDDQTVAKTNGSNTRSALGIIRDVDDLGVWVEI